MATIRRRNGRYQVQVRRLGYPTLSGTFIYRKDAEAWGRRRESQLEVGSTDTTTDNDIKLGTLLDDYCQREVPKLKSQKQERNRIRFLVKELGQRTLGEVNNRLLAEYRDKRSTVVSPQTIRREINLIRRVLKIASLEWDIRLPNGVPAIRLPRLSNGRKRRVAVAEEATLRAHLGRQMCSILTVALETAMRRSEIVQLRWNQLCLKNHLITIHDSKNGEERQIPMSETCEGVLKPLSGRERLFNLQPDSVTQAFGRACRRGGIPDLRFHDLRHEAISRLFEKGLSVPEVATISGHKDFRMVARYTHLRPRRLT